MASGVSPESLLRALLGSSVEPARLRAVLAGLPPLERDAAVDRALGLEPPPEDSAELPTGGVPYLPCSVNTLLALAEAGVISASDVIVDVGAGVGRAALLLHALTGARVVGIEVQRALAETARSLAARTSPGAVRVFAGDALGPDAPLESGTVFFLYCPFSGERLERLLQRLERLARTRTLHLACVDLPLPARRWLQALPSPTPELELFRSVG